MKVCAIDNISPVFTRNKVDYKSVQQNNANSVLSVAPYSSENVRANYFIPAFGSRKSDLDMLIDYMSDTVVNDDCLLRKVQDFSFQYDRNFDSDGWFDLLNTLNSLEVVFASGKKKSFLGFLEEEHSIEELLNSKEFSPSKALYFLQEYFSRDISHFQTFTPQNTLNFMVDFAKSKQNNEQEYVDAVLYFRNMQTKDGEYIFENEYGKFGEYQYNAVKHILDVETHSVEASNLEMLLNLVKDGIVNKHVFRDFPIDGEIAAPIVQDISTLYDAYVENKAPIDVFVPTFKSEEDAKKALKVGDVFELEGQENIFILDKKLQAIQLKMDKPTYFKLFPPIERYATSQNQIGNCWELTSVNSLLCDPEERSKFLSLYEQDGDDIIIVFPRTNNKTRFKNAQLPPRAKDEFYSFGAQGIRLFEYAHGKEIYSQKIFELYRILSESIENAKTEEERATLEEQRVCFDDLLKENKNAIYYREREDGCIEFSDWGSSSVAESYDTPYSYSRDGGFSVDMYYNLGYDTKAESLDDGENSTHLSSPEFFVNNLVSYATPSSDEFGERTSDGRFHMSHVYRILPKKVNEGIVQELKLIDPHSIVEVSVSPSDLKKYGGELYLARKNKPKGPSFLGGK